MAKKFAAGPDGNKSTNILAAACCIPLSKNSTENPSSKVTGWGNTNPDSPVVKEGNENRPLKQIGSIRIPLLQLDATRIATSNGGGEAVDYTTRHFLAAWAVLLATYTDVEYPYFGYTGKNTSKEANLLCQACVRYDESFEKLLSSVSVDAWHQISQVSGGHDPIYNTRFIDFTGDLSGQRWEKVGKSLRLCIGWLSCALDPNLLAPRLT